MWAGHAGLKATAGGLQSDGSRYGDGVFFIANALEYDDCFRPKAVIAAVALKVRFRLLGVTSHR